ncbi:MAG: glycosyltransferase family 2 protein [marine benthic group bacterium]|nr:glycosyltransferase family 2 protein [Gemmatimonadota bacterium]
MLFTRSMNSEIRLSVVVPLFNEQENVPHLVRAVREALGEGHDWELLLVDDGSTDGTRVAAESAEQADDRVRLLPLARNYGQTAAMQAGFDHSRGRAVVSMDGDLQNDPADIPALVARLADGYDLVAGYRVRRQDRLLTRKLPSWAANRVIGRVTGVPIRDNGCSLKAYRRELLERMHLYSDMHRFIPAMAMATAGARVTEMPVRHHARRYGESKYGLSRIWKVTSDLITLRMLSGFRGRPLVMFGVGALGSSLLSFLFILLTAVGLAGAETATGSISGDFVFPSVALVFLSLSFFLLLLGLVGEVAISGARETGEPGLPVARESFRW